MMTTPEQVRMAENIPLTNNTVTAETSKKVPLDELKQLVSDLSLVESMIKQWELKREDLRKVLREHIGEGNTGTIDGHPVFNYGPTNKFAVKRFTDDYPQIAEQFTHAKVVQVLNEEELARALPDLFEQYRVRSLRPVGPRG